MKRFAPSAARITLASAALLCAARAGAQGIPPNMQLQPNGAPKPSAAVPLNAPLPATSPTAPAPAQFQPPRSTTTVSTVRRAQVTRSGHLLTVVANNSSLNQILREIARQTGITITGGVTDERVYGTYGPADLSSILTTLLDGTGSNMMLSGDTPDAPQVLTLTSRQGGASPPSPQASGNDDNDPQQQDLPPQLTPRTTNNPAVPQTSEAPPQPRPFTPPTAQPDPIPQPAASTTTTDQSPNGVKTPQQIYDQLMKLQSQQPKAPQ